METKRYGLFTAIAMIIGTVIGSGIFFKSDNILYFTRGNVLLGLSILTLSAIAIIFGCLTINQLVGRTHTPGGIVTYARTFGNTRLASAFGWFFSFVYYPTLSVVISWVVGIYTCMLFDIESTLSLQLTLGVLFMVLCILYNLFIPRFAGFFQRFTTLIKLVPLLLIALLGLWLGRGGTSLDAQSVLDTPKVGWLAAVAPIAFSFDGWIVVTTITSELKNPKRDMGIALVFSPILILFVYALYFLGVTRLVGVGNILKMGDTHVTYAADTLFGPFGSKLLMTGVLLSVMGTENGVVMAGIRAPYELSREGSVPFQKYLRQVSHRWGMPLFSGLFFLVVCLVWYLIHYLTLTYELLPHSDISEISIVVQYLLYVLLYAKVIMLYKEGEIKKVRNGLIFPVLAILGSGIVVAGGLLNPLAVFYAAVCLIFMAVGYFYQKRDIGKV